mmetsp:Transcript_29368/g.80601  ORF Transcript_29368/g.80601 Transcript_29368/m.80601 type:complete len:481 (+) Transcript_29368:753-2195(+)
MPSGELVANLDSARRGNQGSRHTPLLVLSLDQDLGRHDADVHDAAPHVRRHAQGLVHLHEGAVVPLLHSLDAYDDIARLNPRALTNQAIRRVGRRRLLQHGVGRHVLRLQLLHHLVQVHGGEDVLSHAALGDHDRIFVVVPLEGQVCDDHVLAYGQLTAGDARTVCQRLAHRDLVAGADAASVVPQCVLLRIADVHKPVTCHLRSHLQPLLHPALRQRQRRGLLLRHGDPQRRHRGPRGSRRLVVALRHHGAGDRGDHSAVRVQHVAAHSGVDAPGAAAGHVRLHARADDGALGPEAGHGLLLHLSAHEHTVGVVMLHEWDGGHSSGHWRRTLDIVDPIQRAGSEAPEVHRGDHPRCRALVPATSRSRPDRPAERAVRQVRVVELRHPELVLLPCEQVLPRPLQQPAPVDDAAVRHHDLSIRRDAGVGRERHDHACGAPLAGLDGANTAVLRRVDEPDCLDALDRIQAHLPNLGDAPPLH